MARKIDAITLLDAHGNLYRGLPRVLGRTFVVPADGYSGPSVSAGCGVAYFLGNRMAAWLSNAHGLTMNSRAITYYLDGRQGEWATSAFLITLGVAILIWPIIAHGSILQVLVGNIGAVATAILFIITGMIGIAALIINGRSLKIGPHVRSLTSIVRMVIWASFTLSMFRVSLIQGFPSPMVLFFGYFTIAEAYTPYRAILDVRTGS